MPTACAYETWRATISIYKKLDISQQKCLRTILKTSYRDHIANADVLRLHTVKLQSIAIETGHILHLAANRHQRLM